MPPKNSGAYISAGGSILSTLIGSIASGIQQRREYGFNQDLADQNYQNNLDLWNRQASYNNPVTQAQFLRSAGLSESAVASALGGGSAGLASVSPAAPAGSIASSLGAMVGNSANDIWQNLFVRSQIDKNYNDIDNSVKITEQNIKESDARITEISHRNNLSDAEADQMRKLTPFLVGKSQAEIAAISEGIKKTQQEVSLLKSQTSNVDADTENKQLEKEEISARIENVKSQTAVNNAEVANINQDTSLKSENTNYQIWLNSMAEMFGVDPRTGWLTQIVDLILSGKGDNFLNALVQFLDSFNSSLSNKGKSGLSELKDIWRESLNDADAIVPSPFH